MTPVKVGSLLEKLNGKSQDQGTTTNLVSVLQGICDIGRDHLVERTVVLSLCVVVPGFGRSDCVSSARQSAGRERKTCSDFVKSTRRVPQSVSEILELLLNRVFVDRVFIQAYNEANFKEELNYAKNYAGIAITERQFHRLKELIDNHAIKSILVFPLSGKSEETASTLKNLTQNN